MGSRPCKLNCTDETCVDTECYKCPEFDPLDDYQRCLKWICEQDAQIPTVCSYDGGVYSCTWAARDLKISVKKVRQIMKQLEADGYVRKGYAGGYDDWNERIWCIHGYAVTKKARELTWWKEKRAQEEEDLRRMAEDEYS